MILEIPILQDEKKQKEKKKDINIRNEKVQLSPFICMVVYIENPKEFKKLLPE